MNSVKTKKYKTTCMLQYVCCCVKLCQESESMFDLADLLGQKITMTRLRPF